VSIVKRLSNSEFLKFNLNEWYFSTETFRSNIRSTNCWKKLTDLFENDMQTDNFRRMGEIFVVVLIAIMLSLLHALLLSLILEKVPIYRGQRQVRFCLQLQCYEQMLGRLLSWLIDFWLSVHFYSAHIHSIECSWRLADVLACSQILRWDWSVLPLARHYIFPFENFGAC
jgi:hypothetical protein